ncbi:hypothetical protein Bhyg_05998 [Pseudolycoriella hygida]|uniref:Uncharacterized protein n=1 Tax=Pseudolycoriella hygida TaxID=35572 RepID=A0A9Q0N1T7_9DIPT|nr:hypothetical protein Bhyg_05998 [Pseudolycoriella hygida]
MARLFYFKEFKTVE